MEENKINSALKQECKFAQYVKQGMYAYIFCSIQNYYCGYQRYCLVEQKVKLSSGAINCKIKKEKEENINDL